MKAFDNYAGVHLSELEFLSQEQAELLQSYYNIFTLGQLMGVTWGFSNTELFEEHEELKGVLPELLALVPEEEREKYRSYSREYPTGLIKNKDDEDKSEDITE